MELREPERIKDVYQHYEEDDYYHRIWYGDSPGNLFLSRSTEKSVFSLLEKHGLRERLGHFRILEVGCGGGHILTQFVRWGANENLVFGVDLIEARVKSAQAKLPAGSFQCADAADLPYPNQFFDLILQFTMLSSILDQAVRRKVAKEMLRVLKPGRFIVSFDTRYPNPQNPNTRPVPKSEFRSYFQGCRLAYYPVLLIPQLARFLAPFSISLCRFLERCPVLSSHYLTVIEKSAGQK